MERRTLLILGGAAAVSVGAALVLTPDTLRERETAAGTLAFEGLAAKLREAQKIEVSKPDATLVLLRQGEAWVLPDRGNYPVRAEKVRELLVGLTELRLVEPRTADRTQLDRLGVDDPMRAGSTAVLLRILGPRDLPIAELVVGRRRVRTQGNVPETVYVRRPAETQAWLAEGRLAVDADPQLWVDRDIANIAQDRIRRVLVKRVGEPELILGRGAEPAAKLRILSPPDPPSFDEVALDEIARSFEYLTFLDVKAEAAVHGTALGETRFELTDGTAVTVWPSREADTLWIKLRAGGDPGGDPGANPGGNPGGGPDGTQLNARWTGWAYQVGVWKEKAFMPRLEEVLEREAPAAPAAPTR